MLLLLLMLFLAVCDVVVRFVVIVDDGGEKLRLLLLLDFVSSDFGSFDSSVSKQATNVLFIFRKWFNFFKRNRPRIIFRS